MHSYPPSSEKNPVTGRNGALASFHKLDNVPVGIFNHCNADSGTDFFLRQSELYPFLPQLGTNFGKVLDDKSCIAKPKLILQPNSPFWRDTLGFD